MEKRLFLIAILVVVLVFNMTCSSSLNFLAPIAQAMPVQDDIVAQMMSKINFRLKTYFITPVEQLNKLHELGYSDIKMYSLRDGREIKNPNNTIDRYIYYLSKAP